MTSPLTPEAVAQMVADMQAGTPGPWYQTLKWEVCYRSDADDQSYGMMCPIIDVFGECKEADINRVQRLPDLEAAYLTLSAENATLRAELDQLKQDLSDMRDNAESAYRRGYWAGANVV